MPFIPGHVCFLQRWHERVFRCRWPSGTTRWRFAGRSSSGSMSLNKSYIFRAETRVGDWLTCYSKSDDLQEFQPEMSCLWFRCCVFLLIPLLTWPCNLKTQIIQAWHLRVVWLVEVHNMIIENGKKTWKDIWVDFALDDFTSPFKFPRSSTCIYPSSSDSMLSESSLSPTASKIACHVKNGPSLQ